MSSRSIIYAGLASLVLVAVGAILQDGIMVVGGMVSTMVAALLIAIKTDETTQPMQAILLGEREG